MEKNSLQQFFEALSSKITGCFLSKNKIYKLSYLKFNERNPIDYLSKFSDLTLIKALFIIKNQFRVGSLVVLLFFFTLGLTGQTTLPAAKSCVSNDLEIVGARIITPSCFQCESGTADFPLELSINNKTSSFRPTFAFWGTLEVTNGATVTETPISGCNDATGLPKNKITSVVFQNISYTCGTTLRLKNLYLAWTDASNVVDQTSGNSCTNLTTKLNSKGVLDISPKCGTPTPVDIQTPLVASDAHANVSCYGGSDGTVTLTFSGGIPPYFVEFNNTGGFIGQVSPKTYSGLAAGIYTWTVKDSRTPSSCEKSGSETVGGPLVGLALGTCSKTDVSCSGGDGSVTAGTVSNAVGTVHYSWKNSSDVEVGTTASVPSLAADTYTLTVSDDCSSMTCEVTVGAPPAISTPAATVVQPTCSVSTGTVNVTSPVSGVIYTLRQLGVVIKTAVNGVFSTVAAGTYQFFASNGICSAQGNNVIVDPQPATPAAPTFCVVLPSLCDITKKGSLTITAPLDGGGIDYEYSIDNGTNWQESVVFNGLNPGSVTGVKVRNKSTLCTSSPANCNESNICPPPANKMTETIVPKEKEINNETQKAGFDAYPVPFKDQLTIRYNFDYASKVKIEVFDSQGNLMLSKMDTNSYLNKEIALDLKLNRGRDQVYVVKVTTDRESSTKKVISSR